MHAERENLPKLSKEKININNNTRKLILFQYTEEISTVRTAYSGIGHILKSWAACHLKDFKQG